MRLLKKLTSNSNFWPVVVVIFFGLLAAKGLIGAGYFNMHDDLQMMRQLEIEKCFLTLQIPCRWVPDMGYGFGFPLFNFYPPLPYLFGEIFRIFGVSFVDTVKLTFIFAFVASGTSMYFLAKEFWGKWGGIISSIFYIWAPYHSVDIYVRGAMNEAWALIFFPAILVSSYKLITQEKNIKRNTIFLALGWFGLLLSHNLMAMIFAPVFVGWCLLWILKSKEFTIYNFKFLISKFLNLLVSGILALGLAAFFTLPVLVEQKYVNTQSLIQGYYDYSSHFATIKQLLFSRFWGYGASVWGANDGLTFQVGYLLWIPVLIIVAITIFSLLKQFIKTKKIKLDSAALVVGYFFVVGWFAIFMVHNKSTPIWLHINALRFVQFPWRFLTVAILAFSFVVGSVPVILKKLNLESYKYVILTFLVGAVLVANWNYFLPQGGKLGALTDSQKFNGAAWELQQGAGILDYLPNTAKKAPTSPMRNFVEVMDGSALASKVKLGTNINSFDIDVAAAARIRLGLFEFPVWRVQVDGKSVNSYVSEDEEWGRIYFLVPVGKHHVDVRLYNTPVRDVGNIISLISWAGLAVYLMVEFRRGHPSRRTL